MEQIVKTELIRMINSYHSSTIYESPSSYLEVYENLLEKLFHNHKYMIYDRHDQRRPYFLIKDDYFQTIISIFDYYFMAFAT